ncbi:hypothetical protein QL285_053605 [Trifolium repens]|nr:hypothetical protein QL285_053605 [Trifolium repens]
MSTKRAAIKKIENRIAVLSKEDPTKNEQVIREFESLRESLLLLNPNEEEDEEEEEYVDLQLLEKKRVVKVIMDLLSFDDEHRQSAFTPDLLDNLQDVVDPMLLLNDNDLDFIHNSVEKLYDCSYGYAIFNFCEEAKDWLKRPTDSDGDDDDVPNGDDGRITVLREHFNRIISARNEKVKLNIIKKSEEAYARALALEQSYNNNPDTNTDFYEESSESDKDSDSDEEKQEKSPILERDRKKEFYDGHGRQSNRKRLKTSDEEQQEKSFVPMSSKFEHDGAMLGCYDAGLMREDVRAE